MYCFWTSQCYLTKLYAFSLFSACDNPTFMRGKLTEVSRGQWHKRDCHCLWGSSGFCLRFILSIRFRCWEDWAGWLELKVWSCLCHSPHSLIH